MDPKWLLPAVGSVAILTLAIGSTLMNNGPGATQAPTHPDAIVELSVSGGSPTTSSGFRVLPTGEYQIALASTGGPASSWRTIWVYSDQERKAVQAAIDAADDPPLPAVVGSGPARDGGTARWRLRTTKRTADVVITGYPVARLPALDRLYADLQRLHAWPAGGSLWRVSTDESIVVRTARCDALTLPALQTVMAALYPTAQDDTPGRAEADDLEPALIDVTWYADGRIVDRLRVFRDGRRHGLRDGSLHDLPKLARRDLSALLDAISATPWRSLPEPLCESTR